jgi:hypothetical protein
MNISMNIGKLILAAALIPALAALHRARNDSNDRQGPEEITLQREFTTESVACVSSDRGPRYAVWRERRKSHSELL